MFLVAAFAIYWNSLHSEFLGDDYGRISTSAKQLFEQGLDVTLAELLPDRPFLTFTVWLNWKISGLDYFAFKATNIVLHGLCGFALFKLLTRLSRRHFYKSNEGLALVLGILFVVHPVATQSLNHIIQRGVLLSALFAITSFYYFLQFLESGQRRDYLFCFLAMFLGIISKPFVITLPLIFAAYVLIFHKKIKTKDLMKWILPLMVLALIPSLFLFGLKSNTQNLALPWYQYLIIQARVIFIYFRLFLLPINLHFLYSIEPDATIFKNLTWLAILGHVGILALSRFLIKKNPLVTFAIFAMYLALLSESGVFPIEHLVFEHRTYFPYVFIFIGIWAAIMHLKESARKIIVTAIIPIIFAFSFLTIERNGETDTFLKWVLNTLSYNSNDHVVNIRLIELLHEYKDSESVKAATSFLLKKHPDHGLYTVWNKTTEYPALSKAEKKKNLEFLGYALIENSGRKTSQASTLFLNRIFIGRVYEVNDEFQASLFLEKVLASQEPKFIKEPDTYFSIIKFHATVLKYLKGYFEEKLQKKEQLSSLELSQYNYVLMNIEKYFNTKEPNLKTN
jgi:hypothetical protein